MAASVIFTRVYYHDWEKQRQLKRGMLALKGAWPCFYFGVMFVGLVLCLVCHVHLCGERGDNNLLSVLL